MMLFVQFMFSARKRQFSSCYVMICGTVRNSLHERWRADQNETSTATGGRATTHTVMMYLLLVVHELASTLYAKCAVSRLRHRDTHRGCATLEEGNEIFSIQSSSRLTKQLYTSSAKQGSELHSERLSMFW